jgi:hypothetical protein
MHPVNPVVPVGRVESDSGRHMKCSQLTREGSRRREERVEGSGGGRRAMKVAGG